MNPLERIHGAYVYRRRTQRLAGILSSLIPSACRLLDVGSGDGKLAQLLLATRPDLHIQGVDVLVRKQTSIPVMPFDGTHLPYPTSSFDGVMLIDVLHHTRDPLPLLHEALRVSRRWLVVKDHVREGVGAAARLRFMDYVGNARHQVSLSYNYLSSREWAALQTGLNLKVITELSRLHLYPWPADYVFGASLHFAALWEHTAR
jgi:SAM-dependent methyltransferase